MLQNVFKLRQVLGAVEAWMSNDYQWSVIGMILLSSGKYLYVWANPNGEAMPEPQLKRTMKLHSKKERDVEKPR